MNQARQDIAKWPEEWREAASLVFDRYHHPDQITERITPLAEFDGSVIVERTAREISARCHDVGANFLALDGMHDIVTGAKNVEEAGDYYATEFLDYRRGKLTLYREGLRFDPPRGDTADLDQRVFGDDEIESAAEQGQAPTRGLMGSSAYR